MSWQCSQNDLVYIHKLKAVSGEQEWVQYREQILQSRKNYNIRYLFMEDEKLYGRMLEYLKSEDCILNMDRYEKLLKEKFPEQVRDIYISYLNREARRVSDRNRYRELMNILENSEVSGWQRKGGGDCQELADGVLPKESHDG